MKLVRRLRGERAYTMVELITVMLIMSIVMTGITTVFVQGSNAELNSNYRFQSQTAVRLALDLMRKDIHCSSVVTSSTTLTATASPLTSITLSDPCAVHSQLATQGVFSGTGTGTFTLNNPTDFPTASSTYQIDQEQFTATRSGTTVTITARGFNQTVAVSHALGATVTLPGGFVSWCAVTVGGVTGLYRRVANTGPTCGSASPAVKEIDRLTTTGIFWNQPAWPQGGFGLVFVKLAVNTATAKGLGATTSTYTLCDGIVMRNSKRATGTGTGFFGVSPNTYPTGC